MNQSRTHRFPSRATLAGSVAMAAFAVSVQAADGDTARMPKDAAATPLTVVWQSLLEDPNLLAKVAARNGMTPARFMGQEEGRILHMTRTYLNEQQSARTASPNGAASSPNARGAP